MIRVRHYANQPTLPSPWLWNLGEGSLRALVYTSQGTCWAYISICSHAWLEECGWSWAGLTTDPHKLVLSTTGENWALEILSNDHIKNYFKMLHQALLLMDILEIVFCLSIVITAALVKNSRGSQLGWRWRHIYWRNVCVKSSIV